MSNNCSECCGHNRGDFYFPALVVQLKLCKICFPFASLDTFKKHFYCNGNLKKHDQNYINSLWIVLEKTFCSAPPPPLSHLLHKIIHSKCNFMHFNCLRKLWFWSWEHLNFSIAMSFYVERNFTPFLKIIMQLLKIPDLFFCKYFFKFIFKDFKFLSKFTKKSTSAPFKSHQAL